jgi:hypothetical protein
MSATSPTPRRRASDLEPQGNRQPQAPNYGIKRMIFIASMFFSLTGVKDPTFDQLKDVNKRFHLAHGDRTLLFPAAISGMVWGKIDLNGYLAQYKEGAKSFLDLARQIVADAPFWTRYGEPEVVADDIKAVFDSVKVA